MMFRIQEFMLFKTSVVEENVGSSSAVLTG